MGVALPLPGRGGGISPHMKAFVGYFLKSSPQSLCPKGHRVRCNIPCCRGRGASSSTKQTHGISTPQGHHLGLNALRLRGGMGAA